MRAPELPDPSPPNTIWLQITENSVSFVYTKIQRKYEGVGSAVHCHWGQQLQISWPYLRGCVMASSAPSTVPLFKAGGRGRGKTAHSSALVLFYQEGECFPRNHRSPAKLCLWLEAVVESRGQHRVQGKLDRQTLSLSSLHRRDRQGEIRWE